MFLQFTVSPRSDGTEWAKQKKRPAEWLARLENDLLICSWKDLCLCPCHDCGLNSRPCPGGKLAAASHAEEAEWHLAWTEAALGDSPVHVTAAQVSCHAAAEAPAPGLAEQSAPVAAVLIVCHSAAKPCH